MIVRRRILVVIIAVAALASLSCSLGGLLAGQQKEAIAPPTRTPRPTFTPTPGQPAEESQAVAPATVPPTDVPPTDTPVPPTATPVPPSPTPQPPTATAVPEPYIVVAADTVNVRSGPSTAYERVGQVAQDQRYDIIGKNSAGDWWQICCVEAQQVWVTSSLVDSQGDLGRVAVVANIPPPPPTNTPRPTNTPAPTATPEPQFAFSALGVVETRSNGNDRVTVWAQLFDRSGKIPVKDRLVRVTRGGIVVKEEKSLFAPGSFGPWYQADPGMDSEFDYNVKIEFSPATPGTYEVFVAKADGSPDSPSVSFVVTGPDDRTVRVAFKEK